jgi:DNA-binding SARP family transcriptional activator
MLQINLLGVPEVCRDGVRRDVPKGKVLALLAYLAVEGGLHPREEVAALLWPQAHEQEGRNNLRTALTMLRKALGEQPGTPAVLRTVANAIGLEPAAVLVDVHALETAAALARQGKAVPDLRGQLEHAIAAWHGPLLNGIGLRDAPDFETWLQGERCLIPCDELAVMVSSSIDGLAIQMAAGVPLSQQAATRDHVLRALLALVQLPPTHPPARDHRSTDELRKTLLDEDHSHDT